VQCLGVTVATVGMGMLHEARLWGLAGRGATPEQQRAVKQCSPLLGASPGALAAMTCAHGAGQWCRSCGPYCPHSLGTCCALAARACPCLQEGHRRAHAHPSHSPSPCPQMGPIHTYVHALPALSLSRFADDAVSCITLPIL